METALLEAQGAIHVSSTASITIDTENLKLAIMALDDLLAARLEVWWT